MIKSRYIFLGLAMILMLAGCGANRKTIRFGAAGIGGMYDSFANAYVSLANKEDFSYKLETRNTAGSAANVRLLSGKYIELGIAQADLVEEAYHGTGEFRDKAYQGYKAVAALYPEACQIVVRTDSEIETLDDLLGKTISIGAEESGTERNANQILQAQGISGDMVKTVNLDYTEAAAKLADGEIDAFFCTAGTQTTVIGELAKECGIRLLSIDVKCRNRLKAAYPFYSEYTIPEIWSHFGNMHPDGKPIWSFMFITVACGAISGFHSTQSPLMARCMKSEKQGHFVFYGAMVAEGVIALIWAAAGCSIYEVTGGLNTGLAEILSGGQSAAIYDVCIKTMGSVGVALAMIGVIVCPITSGDTAFRSARLVLADWFKIDQDKIQKRLLLCVPLLAVGAFVGHLDYAVVWRYFSWTNQTLAMIVLWTASMYLFREKKNYWIAAVPATFMSAVSMTYFFCADECLGFSTAVAYPVGIILAVVFLGTFIHATKKPAKM